MAISLGSGCGITLYYILDPICSQQRARDHSKLQEKVVAKVISVLVQQKKNIMTLDENSCFYLSEFVTMTIQCGIVLQTVGCELEVMVFTIIFICVLIP